MKKMVFQNGFVGIALVAMVVAVFAAASCASSGGAWRKQSIYPPTIADWIHYSSDEYYGVGMYEMDGYSKSFSINMARTEALGGLVRSIEVSVAYIDGRIEEKVWGTTDSEVTKISAEYVLRGVRTVGPVEEKGWVYILQYIPRDEFDKAIKEAAIESKAKISEADLDKLLDEAYAQSH